MRPFSDTERALEMSIVTCLKASLLSDAYKGAMVAEIATLRHPDDLKKCVELSSRALDHMGRVVAVMWRGTEVAVFFKREVVKVDTDAPVALGPATKILESDRDAWIILDTMANSNVNATVKALMDKLAVAESRIAEYRGVLEVQRVQCDQASDQISKLVAENVRLHEQIAKLTGPPPQKKPRKAPAAKKPSAPAKKAPKRAPSSKTAVRAPKQAPKRAKKAS